MKTTKMSCGLTGKMRILANDLVYKSGRTTKMYAA